MMYTCAGLSIIAISGRVDKRIRKPNMAVASLE